MVQVSKYVALKDLICLSAILSNLSKIFIIF